MVGVLAGGDEGVVDSCLEVVVVGKEKAYDVVFVLREMVFYKTVGWLDDG